VSRSPEIWIAHFPPRQTAPQFNENLAHRCHVILISRLPDCNFEMPDVFRTQQDSPTREGVLMRPWMRAVLEVAIMAATMCSGIMVGKYDVLVGDNEGHEGGRDIRENQRDLDRAA
jgi:hypothetical protein